DAKLLRDDLGNSNAGPDLSAEAVRLSTMPQKIGYQPLLLGRQFGRMARSGVGRQGFRSLRTGARKPPAYRCFRNAQGLGNESVIPTLLLQLQRPQPPPFAPASRVNVRSIHPAI